MNRNPEQWTVFEKVPSTGRFVGLSQSEILQIALLAVLYTAGVVEAMVLGRSKSGADVIWPANGILLGMMLRVPRRLWRYYLSVTAFLNAFIAYCFFPSAHVAVAAWTIGNVAEVIVAALLLQGREEQFVDLMHVRTFLLFLAEAVLLSPIIPSSITAARHLLINHLTLHTAIYHTRNQYWGNALGIAIMTPLMLIIRSSEVDSLFRKRKFFEVIALLAAFISLSLYIFSQNYASITFLIYPALLLVIFRLGVSAAAIAVALLAFPAAFLTSAGRGPFVGIHEQNVIHAVLLLQLFLSVLAITVFVVGAVLREKEELQQELRTALHQLEKTAETDFLTQLPNRRNFDARLQQEWSISFRQQDYFSLLMIDIDHFKSYNDTFGHPAGDALIFAVAQALRKSVERPRDFVARYGGEEFVVLLPHTFSLGATVIAERMRRFVSESQGDEFLRPVTISIGVATAHPSLGGTRGELLQAADIALYAAKRAGRNNVCV